MTPRTGILITAICLCHLLLAPPLVTSQLRSPAASSTNGQISDEPAPFGEDTATIRSLEQEKNGALYQLRGQVEIHYRGNVLYADEVTYNSATGEATADGNVVIDGSENDEHLQAAHATYNLKTETGKFDNVVGTIGLRTRGARFVLTSPAPFYFTGKVVEKDRADHYIVEDGTVTTCELPSPKWKFLARKITVDVRGDARIYHSAFFIKSIPIFYLPYATQPVVKKRQSGLLIPNLGNSSRKGAVLGESVFWAINRSMDTTLGAEYYSRRGWSPQGEFRARPSEKSFIDLNVFTVLDRGITQFVDPNGPNVPPGPQLQVVDQGGANVRLEAESTFLNNFRAVANVDYLSSYVFRLAFNEVFNQAVNSEVKSQAFLSNTARGFSYNALVQRYQNFESTANGDVITILHAPTLDLSSVERPLAHTPILWSYSAAAEGLSRSEPSFRTAQLVGRFDLHPRVAAPLQLGGWMFRPEIGLRSTIYTQQLAAGSGVGVAVSDPINRRAVESSLELRPPELSRVFGGEFWGRKWKHVIEPHATYRYVTGVDNFNRILRFDSRDILSNTNEVEYGLINRLYAKRLSEEPDDCEKGGMPSLAIGGRGHSTRVPWEDSETQPPPCNGQPRVREVVRWELAQKYFLDPTFGGALVSGRRNVLSTTADLTGIAFLTDPRRLSPLISRLRIQTSARSDAQWDLDYDIKKGYISASNALMNYRFGDFTLGAGDAFMRVPGEILVSNPTTAPQQFNQFRLLLGYGHPNKRGFSGAANIGFDGSKGFLQYASAQTSYNWDCCGITVEYRRFALGQVRNENQFRFMFALANIGSFGNLGKRERLY